MKIYDQKCVSPIDDEDVSFTHRNDIVQWRRLANELQYQGPVAWEVRMDLLLQHHPMLGRLEVCTNWKDYELRPALQALKIPTILVFWIPRFLPESKGENQVVQKEIVQRFRKQHALPENGGAFCYISGSDVLLTALILSHWKATGEQAPVAGSWVQTDTNEMSGYSWSLGWSDGTLGRKMQYGGRSAETGVFPLAVMDAFVHLSSGGSFDEMVGTGKYDWVNPDITEERFPYSLHAGESHGFTFVEEAETRLETQRRFLNRKLRPATFAELLAFGCDYPDAQRVFTVIETGTVCMLPNNQLCVGTLSGNTEKRYLGMHIVGNQCSLSPHGDKNLYELYQEFYAEAGYQYISRHLVQSGELLLAARLERY